MIDETSSTGHGTATGGSAGMANAGTGNADRSGSRTDPGLTGQIGEGARQAGETVRQHATGLAHTLMDEAGKQVERQRERLADRVVGVADIVRDTGQRLAEREPWIGRYIEQGAQGLTTLADGMRDRDPRDLIGQVTDFARRQPALFAGVAVALGFVFARMTRGSIEGAGGARNERWRSGGWQERGDYERASWQDREWQGASPGHAHDDERGYGFSGGNWAATARVAMGSGATGRAIRRATAVRPVAAWRARPFAKAPTSASPAGRRRPVVGSARRAPRAPGSATSARPPAIPVRAAATARSRP